MLCDRVFSRGRNLKSRGMINPANEHTLLKQWEIGFKSSCKPENNEILAGYAYTLGRSRRRRETVSYAFLLTVYNFGRGDIILLKVTVILSAIPYFALGNCSSR